MKNRTQPCRKTAQGAKRPFIRALSTMLCVVLLAACLAGCASASAPADDGTTLRVYFMGFGDVIPQPAHVTRSNQAVMERFAANYPTVELVDVSKDYNTLATAEAMTQKLYNDILNGTGPDLIISTGVLHVDFYKLMDDGCFRDMLPYIEADESFVKEDMYWNWFESLQYKGKQYAVPLAGELPQFYISTEEQLAQYGYDATKANSLEGFLAEARRVMEQGVRLTNAADDAIYIPAEWYFDTEKQKYTPDKPEIQLAEEFNAFAREHAEQIEIPLRLDEATLPYTTLSGQPTAHYVQDNQRYAYPVAQVLADNPVLFSKELAHRSAMVSYMLDPIQLAGAGQTPVLMPMRFDPEPQAEQGTPLTGFVRADSTSGQLAYNFMRGYWTDLTEPLPEASGVPEGWSMLEMLVAGGEIPVKRNLVNETLDILKRHFQLNVDSMKVDPAWEAVGSPAAAMPADSYFEPYRTYLEDPPGYSLAALMRFIERPKEGEEAAFFKAYFSTSMQKILDGAMSDYIAERLQDPTKLLTVYYDLDPAGSATIIGRVIERFERENPGCKIEMYDPTGGDPDMPEDQIATKLQNDLMAGKGPDLLIDSDYNALPLDFYKMMVGGAFEDLLPYIEADTAFVKDDMYWNCFESLQYQGGQYAAPLGVALVDFCVSSAEQLERYGFDLEAAWSSQSAYLAEMKKVIEQGVRIGATPMDEIEIPLDYYFDLQNGTYSKDNPLIQELEAFNALASAKAAAHPLAQPLPTRVKTTLAGQVLEKFDLSWEQRQVMDTVAYLRDNPALLTNSFLMHSPNIAGAGETPVLLPAAFTKEGEPTPIYQNMGTGFVMSYSSKKQLAYDFLSSFWHGIDFDYEFENFVTYPMERGHEAAMAIRHRESMEGLMGMTEFDYGGTIAPMALPDDALYEQILQHAMHLPDLSLTAFMRPIDKPTPGQEESFYRRYFSE